MRRRFRVGQIVPSSNTTMETEIPAMLRARERVLPDRFTFHSSRMRMRKVTKEELAAMDREAERCATELADARVDVMGYACLVAIMSQGPGYHQEAERRLTARAAEAGGQAPVVTSAGALVDGLRRLGAKRATVVTPYVKPLCKLVCDYIEGEGIEVVDSIALGIEDNLEVGARDSRAVLPELDRVSLKGADAVVLSACVQMPSLEAIETAERRLGLPVLSASSATCFAMLEAMGLDPVVPNAGMLLSGRFREASAA